MNEQELEEMIGESVWSTYRDMAYLLSEISAGRIEQAVEKQTGKKEARVASRERQERATDDRHPKNQVSVGTKGGAARQEAGDATHRAKLDLHRTKKQAARVQRRAKGHPTSESRVETDPHAEGGPNVPKIAHDDPTAKKRPKEMSKATKLAKKGQKKAQGR